MKSLIYSALLVILMATKLFAQRESTANYNQKLVDFYGTEYLNNLTTNNPGALKYISYFVDNGYWIEDSPKDISDFQDINSVDRIVSKTNPDISKTSTLGAELFNILTYNIQAKENKQYYRIGDSNKLIVVYSRAEILSAVNKK
jgi:hypothetical protein